MIFIIYTSRHGFIIYVTAGWADLVVDPKISQTIGLQLWIIIMSSQTNQPNNQTKSRTKTTIFLELFIMHVVSTANCMFLKFSNHFSACKQVFKFPSSSRQQQQIIKLLKLLHNCKDHFDTSILYLQFMVNMSYMHIFKHNFFNQFR